MTRLLQDVMRQIEQLPDAEQDAIASRLLAELKDDRLWAEKFARTKDTLRQMAAEARERHARGETTPLDDQF